MEAPKRLKGDARKKWLDVFSIFDPKNEMDVELAIQYCECWADYLAHRGQLSREGLTLKAGTNGVPYPHPSESGKNKCLDQMRRHYKLLAPLLNRSEKKGFDL